MNLKSVCCSCTNPDPPGKLMTSAKWIIAILLISTHLELLAHVIMAYQKLFSHDKNNFHRVFVKRESAWLILYAVWFTNFQTKVLLMSNHWFSHRAPCLRKFFFCVWEVLPVWTVFVVKVVTVSTLTRMEMESNLENTGRLSQVWSSLAAWNTEEKSQQKLLVVSSSFEISLDTFPLAV